MVDFFTEDAVLPGDAEEAFGRDALRAYLRVMADIREEAPFRVTCLAVQEQNGWRLRHFHGSRPQ